MAVDTTSSHDGALLFTRAATLAAKRIPAHGAQRREDAHDRGVRPSRVKRDAAQLGGETGLPPLHSPSFDDLFATVRRSLSGLGARMNASARSASATGS
jgi:hypothetical protein